MQLLSGREPPEQPPRHGVNGEWWRGANPLPTHGPDRHLGNRKSLLSPDKIISQLSSPPEKFFFAFTLRWHGGMFQALSTSIMFAWGPREGAFIQASFKLRLQWGGGRFRLFQGVRFEGGRSCSEASLNWCPLGPRWFGEGGRSKPPGVPSDSLVNSVIFRIRVWSNLRPEVCLTMIFDPNPNPYPDTWP